jgi:hypothetical protein
MQKALVQMNLQLAVVISDITGVTGLRILRDILAGQTDPDVLAQHRDHRCQASAAEIMAALTGHYRPEHLFVLGQNLARFDASQWQMAACDVAIEAHVHALAADTPAPAAALPPPDEEEAAGQRAALRASLAPPSPHRRRPHPDRCDWAVRRPAAPGRDRARHESVAHREAFHLVADPGAPQ